MDENMKRVAQEQQRQHDVWKKSVMSQIDTSVGEYCSEEFRHDYPACIKFFANHGGREKALAAHAAASAQSAVDASSARRAKPAPRLSDSHAGGAVAQVA